MEIEHYLATESFLNDEFAWLEKLIKVRIESYFNMKEEEESIFDLKPPVIGDDSTYERFLLHYSLGFNERVIVAMITASILKPEIYDLFHTQNEITGITYSEFGGKVVDRRFLPTFRTAAFLLNESKIALPVVLFHLFEQSHPFTQFSLLDFSDVTFRTRIDTLMKFSTEAEYLLFTGHAYQPEFNSEFPAKLLTTELDWKDLILANDTKRDIDEVLLWFRNQDKLSEDNHLQKWLKPGYRVLFYGPSGTGKTLTASLLGKTVNRPIYRVDLSMVISKYIGETEKNLAKVFNRAENNKWILFFDEADALFGKRTKTTNANDRHSNQEVAYLLQKIEDFSGTIILATNLDNNLDDAFSRRFQLQIPFKRPDKSERLRLWKQIFADKYSVDKKFMKKAAEDYELTGGALINVLRTAVLYSSKNEHNEISEEVLLYAIKKELEKEGKSFINF